MQQYFASVDIGSQSIKAAVSELKRDGSSALITLLTMPSAGIRRGAVENVVDATQSLSAVLAEIKKISRGAIKNLVVSVGTSETKVQHSKGVVAVSRADDEIYQDDINRVIQSSQAINIPANRMVLHSFIKEYIVDGIDNIRDPLGMVGKRLEVNMLMIDAFAPSVKNITKCLETLGASASETVLGPIASASSVLTRQQKELGVVLIDIGFGKTSVAIYEEERLIHAAIIPVGANNITNDLAIGLRIPIETAEIIKLQFGSALAKEVGSRDVVELAKIDPRAKGVVTKKFIAEIIEDRLAEIFELVNNEVKLVGKASQLPAGAVLTGGGAKMPGITELARQELKVSAHIGVPDVSIFAGTSPELASQAEDPQLACAIGLLLHENQLTQEEAAPAAASQWLKKIFNYFIP